MRAKTTAETVRMAQEKKGLLVSCSCCCCPGDARRWRVLQIGLGFLLVLVAFQTSSFFQAGVLEDVFHDAARGKALGFTGLGLVYGFLAIGNIFAPWAIRRTGLRAALVIGAIPYALMMASLISVVPAVFIAASILNGLGGALLWTAGGAAVTRCLSDESTRGLHSAVFWALSQLSLAGGGMASLLLLPSGSTASNNTTTTAAAAVATTFLASGAGVAGVGGGGGVGASHLDPASTARLYAALTGICASGCIVLAFMQGLRLSEDHYHAEHHQDTQRQNYYHQKPSTRSTSNGSSSGSQHLQQQQQETKRYHEGLFASARATIGIGTESDMVLTVPLIAFSGFGTSFWQGQFPLIVGNGDVNVPLDPTLFTRTTASYLMFALCGGEVSGALLGRLSDYAHARGRGRTPAVLVAALAQAAAYTLVYLAFFEKLVTPTPSLAYLSGFLLGFADSAWNHQVFAILADAFTARPDKAFAFNFIIKGASAAGAFGYSLALAPVYQLLVLSATFALGVAGFVVVDARHNWGKRETASGGIGDGEYDRLLQANN